jgi:hypothetical protein
VLEAVATAGPKLRWLVFDALPVTSHDVTGRYTLDELERELASRAIRIAFAGRQTEITAWRRTKRFDETRPTSVRVFPTLRSRLGKLCRVGQPPCA